MTLQSGSRLGPYEIVARVGAGGMGEVFRARDTRLDRTVAVKILPATHAANAQLRLRFEREAKAISALNHPHICSLYDVGTDSNVDYLVMEFIEGETLADRLTRGPLPIDDALRFGIEIADALDRAHRQGIVHRDLKPGNIMLTRSGVKLLDFGLARNIPAVIDSGDGPTMATEAKPLTAEGSIVGTFQYMSPEQLEGNDADARTDIFAFGAVLYEMATGHRAFDGKTRTSVIAAIVTGVPRPISEMQPLAPRAFEYVVQRCLEKDRESRWQSAHDIKLELLRIAQQNEERAPASRAARAGWIAAALATVAAIGVASFAWNAMRHRQSVPIRAFLFPQHDQTLSRQVGAISISPDGSMVTYRILGTDHRLWIRSTGAEDAHALPGTEGGQFPFWSPDGRWIAFFADEKLKKISLAGTPAVTVCNAPSGRSGSWNEDGVILFSPSAVTPIHRVSAAGGKPAPLTKLDASLHESSHRWAEFLPDGKHFLYLAASHQDTKKSDQNAIWLSSIDHPAERRLVIRSRYNVAYASGRLYFAKEGVLVSQPFDIGKGELGGEPERVADDIETHDGFFQAVYAVSSSGTIVYHLYDEAVRLFRDDDGVRTPLGTKVRTDDMVLSPDASHLAVNVTDDATGLPDIYIYDVATGDATRLTNTPDLNESPVAWFHDGKSVLYATVKGFGALGVHLVIESIDGSAKRVIASPSNDVWPVALTPDGTTFVYESKADTDQRDLWSMPVAGGPATPFANTSENECCLSFSPDGKWAAFWSTSPTKPAALSVARFPSGAQRMVVPCDSTYGGKWIAGGISCSGPDAAYLVPVTESGGTLRFGKAVLLRTAFKDVVNGDSNDGKRFVVAVHEQTREEQGIGIIRP
jgi:Tol biopolymer transport system component